MKKEPISRKFDSLEEAAVHAEEAYGIDKEIVNQFEYDAGFDITNKESVLGFDLGYTPLQNAVILKKIPRELKPGENKLYIVDNSETLNKYFVMAFSPLVTILEKGDVVALGNSPFTETGKVRGVDRKIKGVQFLEVSYNDLGGIYQPREVIMKRIAEEESRNRIGGYPHVTLT